MKSSTIWFIRVLFCLLLAWVVGEVLIVLVSDQDIRALNGWAAGFSTLWAYQKLRQSRRG